MLAEEILGRLGWVIGGPFRLSSGHIMQIAHDPVGRHDEGADRHEILIGFEFGQHMGPGVA